MIGTLDPGRQLKGSETITLTMALDEEFTDGVIEETAKINEFEDKCTTPGSIESLKASGECSVDKTTADYSFDVVIVSGQNKAQTYYYQFEGSDIEEGDLRDVTVYVNGKATTVDLKKGSFELSAGEQKQSIQVIGTLDPGRQLKGSETITLTMALDEGFTDGVIEETAKINEILRISARRLVLSRA